MASRSMARHCEGARGVARAEGSVMGSDTVPPASETRLDRTCIKDMRTSNCAVNLSHRAETHADAY